MQNFLKFHKLVFHKMYSPFHFYMLKHRQLYASLCKGIKRPKRFLMIISEKENLKYMTSLKGYESDLKRNKCLRVKTVCVSSNKIISF